MIDSYEIDLEIFDFQSVDLVDLGLGAEDTQPNQEGKDLQLVHFPPPDKVAAPSLEQTFARLEGKLEKMLAPFGAPCKTHNTATMKRKRRHSQAEPVFCGAFSPSDLDLICTLSSSEPTIANTIPFATDRSLNLPIEPIPVTARSSSFPPLGLPDENCTPRISPVYTMLCAQKDVVAERGHRSNNNPGNARYLREKDRLQPRYLATKSKETKSAITQELISTVRSWGGRFLRFDKTAGRWFELDEQATRRKVSQALRDHFTPEEREEKRRRYKK